MESSHLALLALTYDRRDDVLEIAAAGGGPHLPSVLRHMVDHPERVSVASLRMLAPVTIAVDGPNDVRTVISIGARARDQRLKMDSELQSTLRLQGSERHPEPRTSPHVVVAVYPRFDSAVLEHRDLFRSDTRNPPRRTRAVRLAAHKCAIPIASSRTEVVLTG
jgi:hypothetical protein